MNDEKCKKLLRLLDAQNILLEEATLMSFTADFKLAWGIAGEPVAPYPTTPMKNKRCRIRIGVTIRHQRNAFLPGVHAIADHIPKTVSSILLETVFGRRLQFGYFSKLFFDDRVSRLSPLRA